MTAILQSGNAHVPNSAYPGVGAHPSARARGARTTGTRRRPVFWLTYWLAVALVIAKLHHFGLPGSAHPARLWEYTWEGLIATAADNLLAVGFGLFAFLLLRALANRPRLNALAWLLLVSAGVLLIDYAVASAYVFNFTRTPITHELLRASGSWQDMKSSVLPYCSGRLIATLIGGPLAFIVIVLLSHRCVGMPRGAVVRAVTALLTVGVIGQVAYSQEAQHVWTRRVDHRIAINPHWALFASCVLGMSEGHLNLPTDIPPEYDADFQPMRDRPTAGVVADPPRAGFRPRHVIVYVMESTSTQFFHLYGSPFPTTPNLDREAGHGVVYENIYSQVGMTPSALVGITSSNFARTIWNANPNDAEHSLCQPGVLLSEVLKQRGFRTLAITASNFKFAHQRTYLEGRGFDQIIDRNDLGGPDLMSWGKTDAAMMDRLLQWIDASASQSAPFFALCWTNQTHHPYVMTPGSAERDVLGDANPPPPANRRDINRYLNILIEEDCQLERLMEGLRARGLADDTLVVVTGDHGEGFNWPHESFGHGFRLYEENLHVPCVVMNPRLFPAGRRDSAVGNHIDLAPTIVDLLGIAPAGTWQGHSLLDARRPDRAYFYGAFDDYLLGIRQGDWKYTYNATTGYDELYNVRLDPHETTDVFREHPDICQELRRRASAWARHLEREGPGVAP